MELTTEEFQAKCLEIIEQARENHEEVIITRAGKPVAKLVPVEEKTNGSLFGRMKGTVKVNGDILAPLDENWTVENQGFMELMKVISCHLSQTQLEEVKELLGKYFAQKASDEADEIWKEKGFTDEAMDKWLNEHNRTAYK